MFVSNVIGVLRGSRLLLLLVLATFSVAGLSYELEITQPKSGFDAGNRFHRAYPGLPLDVAVAAIGGVYPYTFELTAAPGGVQISATTGTIRWDNPVEQADRYDVTARVTDALGTVRTVSWQIQVTKQGFLFVDAVNGKTVSEGGDGSLAQPWKSIADWYKTKYDQSFANQFLYFRTGVYRVIEAPREDGWRMAVVGGVKPVVWLAYPGETPTIDTDGSHVSFYGATNNAYVEGFQFRNFTAAHGLTIDSDANDVTIRKNDFRGMPATSNPNGTNLSAIMIRNAVVRGSKWSISENAFSDIYNRGFGILGYSTEKVLVQGNVFTNFDNIDAKAIGPKMNNRFWFIRDNRIDIKLGTGVWIDTYTSTSEIEVSYNLIKVESGNTAWYGQENVPYGSIASFRNSYVGAPIRVDNVAIDKGPVTFTNDVIASSGVDFEGYGTTDTSRLVKQGLLSGTTSIGIVDSSGDLAGAYTQYLNIKGYQRSGSPALLARPRAPSTFAIN